jgi:hypothetical protein
MTASNILNILVLSSLAIFAFFGPPPVNAVSIDSPILHLARHAHHDAIALHKRANNSRRCKPRPSAAHPSSVAPTTTSTPVKSSPPSPSPSPPPPSSNSGGMPKIGIATPLSDINILKAFKTAKVSWYYTWSPWSIPGSGALGYEFIPMLWGDKQIGDFQNLVKKGYATKVFGMNEPNEPGQSNLSPQDAAGLWRQYIDPLKNEGYTLISPACTNGPSGITWMQNFFNACGGCTVNAVATHIYTLDPNVFTSYLEQVYNTFKMPIWVTEFACQDFSGQNKPCPNVYDFMGKVQAFMDQTPYIIGYSAFGVMHDMYNVNPADQLLGSNGQPTALGQFYINN